MVPSDLLYHHIGLKQGPHSCPKASLTFVSWCPLQLWALVCVQLSDKVLWFPQGTHTAKVRSTKKDRCPSPCFCCGLQAALDLPHLPLPAAFPVASSPAPKRTDCLRESMDELHSSSAWAMEYGGTPTDASSQRKRRTMTWGIMDGHCLLPAVPGRGLMKSALLVIFMPAMEEAIPLPQCRSSKLILELLVLCLDFWCFVLISDVGFQCSHKTRVHYWVPVTGDTLISLKNGKKTGPLR